jgi:hypothetical protein
MIPSIERILFHLVTDQVEADSIEHRKHAAFEARGDPAQLGIEFRTVPVLRVKPRQRRKRAPYRFEWQRFQRVRESCAAQGQVLHQDREVARPTIVVSAENPRCFHVESRPNLVVEARFDLVHGVGCLRKEFLEDPHDHEQQATGRLTDQRNSLQRRDQRRQR